MSARRCGHQPVLLAAIVLGLLGTLELPAAAATSVHTVFATECTKYFTWQTLGMMYSHKKSGQPGKITRLMSCTKEELDALSEKDKNIVPTHIAPSFTKHPRTGDIYSAYNKPVAVIDWLAKTAVPEEYILVLDADMIMREPFLPEQLGARPGRAVSAYYGYLKGVDNKLALKHVPEVVPRNDTDAGAGGRAGEQHLLSHGEPGGEAGGRSTLWGQVGSSAWACGYTWAAPLPMGPSGRRGDQVGGFILQHQSDLRRMAPLWLKYSEDVRADPDAWELSGDAYSTHPGDKPWISEMYGYSFGAAKADVWHTCHHTAMLYPGYEASEPPKVLHYGLLYEVKGSDYKFDKHWHYGFDPTQCPPWEQADAAGHKKAGLFPHPPAPSTLETQGLALLRDLLAIEVPITLNEAFCEYLLAHCPASDQLTAECDKARRLGEELAAAFGALELPDPCHDSDTRCGGWAAAGECERNAGFMGEHCRISCKLCTPRSPKAPSHVQSRGRLRDRAGQEGEPCLETDTRCGNWAAAGECSKNEAFMSTHCRISCKLCGSEEEVVKAPGTGQDKQESGQAAGGQQQPQEAAPGEQRAPGKAGDAGGKGGAEGGEARGAVADAPDVQRLQARCQQQQQQEAGWTQAQVAECLERAAEGVRYEPSEAGGSGGSSSSGAHGKAAQEGQVTAPVVGDGSSRLSAMRERDRQRRQHAGRGGGGSDAVAEALVGDSSGRKGLPAHKFEKGRVLRERASAAKEAGADIVVAGTAVMLQKYGVLGILFWAGAILLFFCVLPRARRWRRGGPQFLNGRYYSPRKAGRID
ncbi:hypothetical protein N2152v2_003189 [Parachlorella kessleri]